MTSIQCVTCGACAWPPAGSEVRATFSLRYFSPSGVSTSASEPGAWFCELHRPPRTPVARPVSASPADTLTELENTIAACFARIENELPDPYDDEDEGGDVAGTVEAARSDIERSLASLRKAITPPVPKAKARPKAAPFVRRADQLDIVDAAAPVTANESEAAP